METEEESKLIQGPDRVVVPYLLAVLNSRQHPTEAIRGGANHRSEARGNSRESRDTSKQAKWDMRLT